MQKFIVRKRYEAPVLAPGIIINLVDDLKLGVEILQVEIANMNIFLLADSAAEYPVATSLGGAQFTVPANRPARTFALRFPGIRAPDAPCRLHTLEKGGAHALDSGYRSRVANRGKIIKYLKQQLARIN